MQLITCIWVMLIFAHVAACLLILAAKLDGLPDSSWMVVYGVHQQPDAMHAHERFLSRELRALVQSIAKQINSIDVFITRFHPMSLLVLHDS
jgi:hypothetical protein